MKTAFVLKFPNIQTLTVLFLTVECGSYSGVLPVNSSDIGIGF